MNPTADIAPGATRIMIVDDEATNREVMTIILELEGYVVVSARDGAEALAHATIQPPDLMLLDLMMPGMNGYEVAAAMKGNPATRHVCLLMITALSDRATELAARAAGADDFLTKPLSRASLCSRVRTLLYSMVPSRSGRAHS